MPADHSGHIKKSRQRASVACHGCRERRTRCVVPAGSAICTHCYETGQQCIIRQDDRRRKPVSKAYVGGLQKRIQDLESALKESPRTATATATTSSPSHATPDCPLRAKNRNTSSLPTVFSPTNQLRDGTTTPGHRRYFGPASQPHMKWHDWISRTQEEDVYRAGQEQQQRHAQRVLDALDPDTQQYLMDLFWHHYNSVIQAVHRDAFEQGWDAYYSYFLHMCILAVGYRFADKRRPDMTRDNVFHREAKHMLEHEMENPQGVSSILGFLLLADLEGGCGRDHVGWLYVGVAIQLCFDIGLHRTPSRAQLSPQEIEVRRMTMRACVLYDRYWALFLGRPVALRLDKLDAYQFIKPVATQVIPDARHRWETQVYEALLELMELAGQIADILETSTFDRQTHFQLAALDRELTTWYAQLSHSLEYQAENVRTAPLSFFHLHQQYYSVMILLHSHLGQSCLDAPAPSTACHLVLLSQATCTMAAGRMAQIFWQQRQRFEITQMFSTGLQHAGSAASVLVEALSSPQERQSWRTNKKYLECLSTALEGMSSAYQAAERMVPVLHEIMTSLEKSSPCETDIGAQRRVGTVDQEGSPYHSTETKGEDTGQSSGSMELSFNATSPSSLPSLWGGTETATFSQASELNLASFDVDLETSPINSDVIQREKQSNIDFLT
ncbi:hypothetical protein FE257_008580 [Aspergillus nanangensis]|uniref:Zn(2)-C6 fungal-type domain-containing protein n=1 Tax=Aspergillus nanangensis TaxID=2582783 RepID=A0AAD4CLJ7_ASPNN|nr:hypothetical protein FE257_008580 [Aspergillus nanangensis]